MDLLEKSRFAGFCRGDEVQALPALAQVRPPLTTVPFT
jgi:hypothetical protein